MDEKADRAKRCIPLSPWKQGYNYKKNLMSPFGTIDKNRLFMNGKDQEKMAQTVQCDHALVS